MYIFLVIVLLFNFLRGFPAVNAAANSGEQTQCTKVESNPFNFIGSVHAADANPQIISFQASSYVVVKGSTVTLTWETEGTDKVQLNVSKDILPPKGTRDVVIDKSQALVLSAHKGDCFRIATIFVAGIDDPATAASSIGLIVPTVIAVEGANAAIFSSASNWNMWVGVGSFIERVRRRKPWGLVYDSTTKKPIGRAIVRLINVETNQLQQTSVTDANGIFRLNPKKGSYKLNIVRQGYTFPSRIVTGSSDGGFMNIYSGSNFTVDYDGQPLMFTIPLDTVAITRTLSFVLLREIEAILRTVSDVLLIVGLSTSIAFSVMWPTATNYVFLALNLGILLIKMAAVIITPKEYGTVRGSNGKALPNLEVGVYETDFNTLVARTYTDDRGQYSFILPVRPYNIRIIDGSYKILDSPNGETKPVPVPKNKSNGVVFIAEDIKVRKM